jgi:Tfp pilus assembly protein PilX
MTTNHLTPRSQRGAAALVITLMLFLALALAALALNRHLVFEQRSAANQARATQAFEAAEAGLEWAQAQLNDAERIGADCQPSNDPTATSFRQRYLSIDRVTGAVTPSAVRASCVRTAASWSCSCPASGPVVLATPAGSALAPAFSIRFEPGPRAGTVRVVSNGCTALSGACAPGSAEAPDAAAHTEATLALFAGLRTPPTTALTSRDAVVHTSDQFFAATFGIDKVTWQNQAVVARLTCNTDCGGAIADAIAAGHALIWIDGDLALTGPLTLGSAAQPIVVVARGTARLDGPVTIAGAVYAAAFTLTGTSATVQGAVLNEGLYSGPASPDFRLDPTVLAALAHQTGSFVRVSGSWRDF